jgi:hypothetical protein
MEFACFPSKLVVFELEISTVVGIFIVVSWNMTEVAGFCKTEVTMMPSIFQGHG